MFFKKSKKGLSDVITTVLIILLVLAAVVLIWGFIRKPIEQGGQQIECSSSCLRLSDGLVPSVCTMDASKNNAAVTIRRTSGDDVQLTGLKLIVTSSTGANVVADNSSVPSLLGSSSYIVNTSVISTGSSFTASVAGVISANGKACTCPESLTKLSCS